MSAKKIIAVGLVVGSISLVLVNQKLNKIKTQFEKVKLIPTDINSLDIKLNHLKPQLKCNVSVKFQNFNTDRFTLNGGIVKLQRIIVLDSKGKALGVLTPNVGNLTVPANGVYTLKNIPIVIDLIGSILNIKNYKQNLLNSLKFEAIITVLGIEYKIR